MVVELMDAPWSSDDTSNDLPHDFLRGIEVGDRVLTVFGDLARVTEWPSPTRFTEAFLSGLWESLGPPVLIEPAEDLAEAGISFKRGRLVLTPVEYLESLFGQGADYFLDFGEVRLAERDASILVIHGSPATLEPLARMVAVQAKAVGERLVRYA